MHFLNRWTLQELTGRCLVNQFPWRSSTRGRPSYLKFPSSGKRFARGGPESGHGTDHCGTPAGFHLIECVGGEWNRGGSRDYQRLNAYTALHSVILPCAPPADAVRDNDRWPLHSWRVVNREGSKKSARVGERIVGLLLKRASFFLKIRRDLDAS